MYRIERAKWRTVREAERFRLEREAKRVRLLILSFADLATLVVAAAFLGYVVGQAVRMRGF